MIRPRTWLTIAVGVVAGFEGLRTAAYLDPVGIPTVCFGYTNGVSLGDQYTAEECKEQLTADVSDYAFEVITRIDSTVSQQEIAAYTSFAYNVGVHNFERSTLLRKLNAGDRVGACKELDRWVYARGVKLPGLVNRRTAEKELCLSGIN